MVNIINIKKIINLKKDDRFKKSGFDKFKKITNKFRKK